MSLNTDQLSKGGEKLQRRWLRAQHDLYGGSYD